jgi:alpha-ketoglutarate-dependent taurine dioxygenase
MKTRRLSPTLGVEITGVDLSTPLEDTSCVAVREAWLPHKVAVFPGQHLTEEELMRFGRRSGELEIHVGSTYHSRHQFAGNPDSVYRQIMDFYDKAGGFGHLALVGRSGFMTPEESQKSIRLFTREVLPRLREIAPVEVG